MLNLKKSITRYIGSLIGELSISLVLALGFSVTLFITVIICLSVIWFNWTIESSQDKAKEMQTRSINSIMISRKTEQCLILLQKTESELNEKISLFYQKQLSNEKVISVFQDDSDPLKNLLERNSHKEIAGSFPETKKYFQNLSDNHQQILEKQEQIVLIWKQSHLGLADLLHDARRSMIYWTLKVANMLFIQSSIDELLFENPEDAPLLQIQNHPSFIRFQSSLPSLTETMEKIKPLNLKLWKAANELDMHIMMSEWEKARKLYRDVFPPATKSIGVYLDEIIQNEEDILMAQADTRRILNDEMVPLVKVGIAEIKALRNHLEVHLDQQQKHVANQSKETENTWENAETTIKRIKWTIVLLTIISGIFSVIFINWISKRIIKPIKNLSFRADLISKGDLRKISMPNIRNDEIGLLIGSIDDMSGSLHQLVSEFFTTMDDVAGTAEKISVASRQTAEGMNEQTSFVVDIKDKIENISLLAGKMEMRVEEVTKQSKTSGQKAKEGFETANEALSRMTEIQEIFSDTSDGIMQLKTSSEQIEQITRLIQSIANRSDILAINASIESTRAGENGKGFMVISEEIKALSSQTLEATKSVEKYIKDIEVKTANVVELIKEGSARVVGSEELSKKAQERLIIIAESSEKVTEMIQSTTHIAKSQSDQTKSVTRLVEEISTISQQSNQCANETVDIGFQLNEKSADIRSMLDHFRLN